MSQILKSGAGIIPPGTFIETLTGNTGGPVGPDGSDNINIIGSGGVDVAGNAGTNTLTITAGSSVATTYDADTGSATPSLNILNVHGDSHNVTTTGSGNTLTVGLTGITQYDVVLGGASNALAFAAPSATSGVPLISQGAASNPVFGTAVVAGGGTGDTSFTAYAPICGGTTTTGALQSATTGIATSGFILTSTGAASLPTFQAPAASSITITGDTGGALTGNSFTFTGGTTGLSFGGAVSTETLSGTLVVANGGTGRATLTNHGLLVGAGTSAITQLGNATNGQLPIGSTGADPVLATITAGTNISVTNGAGSISIASSQAMVAFNYSVANATPYVATSNDYYITVDTSTTAITIQLPDAPTLYRIFIIKDSAGNASVRNVTVTTVSGIKLIDAASTFVMNTNYQSAQFLYDGFGYQVF